MMVFAICASLALAACVYGVVRWWRSRDPVAVHPIDGTWWWVTLRNGERHMCANSGSRSLRWITSKGVMLYSTTVGDDAIDHLVARQTVLADIIQRAPLPDLTKAPPPGSVSMAKDSA